jgi:small ligand-binding sensory domain FIST
MTARFALAHASHSDWSHAAEACLAQLAGRPAGARPGQTQALGFLYLSDGLRAQADPILAMMKSRTGITDWVGCSSIGVCATATEYYDEPAMAVLVGNFPAGSVRVFSGTQRPPEPGARTPSGAAAAAAALVHADPSTPDLPGLVIDMAGKIDDGQLFGGASSGRPQSGPSIQIANRVLSGGLSGVVFGADVPLVSRVTQGCHPLPGALRRRVTRVNNNLILELDGRSAVDVLLEDTGIRKAGQDEPPESEERAMPDQLKTLGRRGLFVGIETGGNVSMRQSNPSRHYVIRDVIGIDAARGVVAVSAKLDKNLMVSFCTRDEAAARRDLVRICSEIRDHVAEATRRQAAPAEGARDAAPAIAGAVYVSCLARSSHLFGENSEELRIIQAQLGDVPLVGFFAAGEIYGTQLYGHTGVLTAFY